MDSQFYRKDRKTFRLRERIRKLRKNKRLLIGLVIGIPFVLFLLFNGHGVVARVRLEKQKAELQEKIRTEQELSERLKATSKALDGDTQAIEKVAREKYGMVKEGETVYRVRR